MKKLLLTVTLLFAHATAQSTSTLPTVTTVTNSGQVNTVTMPLNLNLLPAGTIQISEGNYYIANYQNTGINIYVQSPLALRIATIEEMARYQAEWQRIIQGTDKSATSVSKGAPVSTAAPNAAVSSASTTPAKPTALQDKPVVPPVVSKDTPVSTAAPNAAVSSASTTPAKPTALQNKPVVPPVVSKDAPVSTAAPNAAVSSASTTPAKPTGLQDKPVVPPVVSKNAPVSTAAPNAAVSSAPSKARDTGPVSPATPSERARKVNSAAPVFPSASEIFNGQPLKPLDKAPTISTSALSSPNLQNATPVQAPSGKNVAGSKKEHAYDLPNGVRVSFNASGTILRYSLINTSNGKLKLDPRDLQILQQGMAVRSLLTLRDSQGGTAGLLHPKGAIIGTVEVDTHSKELLTLKWQLHDEGGKSYKISYSWTPSKE